jgi:threonine/homoserine/homoserine lactone efflux protein
MISALLCVVILIFIGVLFFMLSITLGLFFVKYIIPLIFSFTQWVGSVM